MNRLSLYETTVEGQQLNELLEAMDGELTPELEERFDNFLKLGKASINAACFVVQSLNASGKACFDEAERLTTRSGQYARDATALKARILAAVDYGFAGKVKTDLFTVWGQTSAETFIVTEAPDCDLQALHEADPELVKVNYALDKTKCRELIKGGTEINGVTVTPHPGTRYLRIR